MVVYTNVAKPTSSVYTFLNPMGKQQYDQANLTYDDSTTYYDGINPNQYTNVSKPATTVYTTIAKPT